MITHFTHSLHFTYFTTRTGEKGWSNPRLGCTGCQHSRLLALVRRLTPLHRGGGTHLRKMTKKWQKRYQKDHPAPQKLKFCKKKYFFYSKIPPILAKNRSFYWKKNNCFLFIFLLLFFFLFFFWIFSLDRKKNWDSFYNRSKKNEVLHEKIKIVLPMGILKKKSRPPTSPNF